MKERSHLIMLLIGVALLSACARDHADTVAAKADQAKASAKARYEVSKTEADWKEELTAEEYRILREQGTERAFTGKYWDHKEDGMYICAACKQPLFSSETKFKSGTGWPSYYAPAAEDAVQEKEDNSLFARRTEVLCRRCGGHLGHVFPDGPEPTGRRYCINSAALDFKPREDGEEQENTEPAGQ